MSYAAVRYLDADLRIQCDSAEYRHLVIFSIVVLAVFAVGIPLFYFIVLWRRRLELFPRNRDSQVTPLSLATIAHPAAGNAHHQETSL